MINILTLSNSQTILYFGKIKRDIKFNNKITFYSPTNVVNKNLKTMYLSNSISNNKSVANIIVNDNKLATRQINYFTDYQPPYNLIKVNIQFLNSPFMNSIWVFRNDKQLKLYPLSVIIWPPAYHISNSIVNDLLNHYIIVKDISFNLEDKYVFNYVMNAYKDDVRCDKTKLKYKINNFKKHPNHFRYIKILVNKPKLNSDNVSETSIAIKKIIRQKYSKFIKNYIYDVILHISDNQKHTKSMFLLTEKYLKKIYLI